jgi:hypothetical protein
MKKRGLQKYASATIWTFIDQRLKKRTLEGKDSEVNIHGRKRSRLEIDKEIARNTTFTSRLQIVEDIPTPDGVQVSTPGAEVFDSAAFQEVNIDNLPWFRLPEGFQSLMGKHYRISASKGIF